MTIVRHYTVAAKPGMAEAMETELIRLADIVRALPGSLGFEVLRDTDGDGRFIFIEKWESLEAHKAAGKAIPREVFAGFMEALEGSLHGVYYACVKSV